MNERMITYVGWRGNLGDEAYLAVNKKIFAQYEVIPDYPMFYGKQYSKISLFGGGTTLPFTSFWIRPNMYNYAFGVGVRRLSFSPEFCPEEVVKKTKAFNFRLLGVRGERSKKTLQEWGIDSEVVGDPCLLLEPQQHIKRNSNLIGLNLSSLKEVWGCDVNKILKEGIKICRSLNEKGYSVILIPFRMENDLPILGKISTKTNVRIFNRNNIQATIDLIASCKVLIGEILPSTIFSAAAFTPFIMIAYQAKCLDFVDTIGFNKYTVSTHKISSEEIIDLTDTLIDNWDSMQTQLIKNVEKLRFKLLKFARRIMDDIESRKPELNFSKPNALGEISWSAYQKIDRLLYRRTCGIWQTAHKFCQCACAGFHTR